MWDQCYHQLLTIVTKKFTISMHMVRNADRSVTDFVLGVLSRTLKNMLTSMRRRVTSSVILPGTISGGIKKEYQLIHTIRMQGQ